MPKHFHTMISKARGKEYPLVEHTHGDALPGHIHAGLRTYATTRKAAERERLAYIERVRAHLTKIMERRHAAEGKRA